MHLVNDSLAPVEGTLIVRAMDSTGVVAWEASQPARAEAAASIQALEVDLPAAVVAAADRSILHATFADVENTLLLAEPKDMRLPLPQLHITSSPRAMRSGCA